MIKYNFIETCSSNGAALSRYFVGKVKLILKLVNVVIVELHPNYHLLTPTLSLSHTHTHLGDCVWVCVVAFTYGHGDEILEIKKRGKKLIV